MDCTCMPPLTATRAKTSHPGKYGHSDVVLRPVERKPLLATAGCAVCCAHSMPFLRVFRHRYRLLHMLVCYRLDVHTGTSLVVLFSASFNSLQGQPGSTSRLLKPDFSRLSLRLNPTERASFTELTPYFLLLWRAALAPA